MMPRVNIIFSAKRALTRTGVTIAHTGTRLLLLAPGIEDRVRVLHSGDHDAPDELVALLCEIERWIGDGDKIEKDRAAIQLLDRARSLQTRIAADAATPDDRLAANLARHLAEMIGLLHDCDRLERNITRGGRSCGAAAYQWPGRASGYVYHRDHWKAARASSTVPSRTAHGCSTCSSIFSSPSLRVASQRRRAIYDH